MRDRRHEGEREDEGKRREGQSLGWKMEWVVVGVIDTARAD